VTREQCARFTAFCAWTLREGPLYHTQTTHWLWM